MTTLYDFLAPAYDPAFQSIYLPFRARAFDLLPPMPGATVLDLACGTGQNFLLLADRIGPRGKIIGVDISSGMLSRAKRRAATMESEIVLLTANTATISREKIEAATNRPTIDAVVCTFGFTAMREWETAFRASWEVLAPGGHYLIHDIDGQRRNFHTWAIEAATRCDFARKVWQPLENGCADFRMDYIDPSAHLFGGRLFVARGTKP